jgi:pimeloyl-ACP methyl ester carboxylesterase
MTLATGGSPNVMNQLTEGTITSRDGTLIAYARQGSGPAVILVDGALCSRELGGSPKIATLLAPDFTVYTYDRRGRGQSGDNGPYAIAREVEDIAALVAEAGGSAHVFGISSGAALALDAANSVSGIAKVVAYEPPFIVDDAREPVPSGFLPDLKQAVAEERRGDAVKLFFAQVGMPRIMSALMPLTPAWRKLKAVAHTLPYDITILDGTQTGRPLPGSRWSSVTAPVLAIGGGKSPEWMRDGARAVVSVVPQTEYRTLPGQTHMVKPKVLAPVLAEYFGETTAPKAEEAVTV